MLGRVEALRFCIEPNRQGESDAAEVYGLKRVNECNRDVTTAMTLWTEFADHRTTG
jgi:hypothetical protein